MASPISFAVEDAIAWITFDSVGERVVKLSREVMEGLGEVLSELHSRSDIRGGLIRSAEDGMFVAGADVAEFQTITDADAAVEGVRAGQAVMDAVEGLPFPVVAAIGGVCLGGGVELALACSGRVGSDHPRFQMGFPEVKLGIFPMWGGATRLPRLVGLPRALDLILTGRSVDAKRAKRMGLLDRAVAHPELTDRALELLEELMAGREPRRPKRPLRDRLLGGNPVGRRVLFAQARKRVLRQTKGHYPAPLAAIEVLRKGRVSKKHSFELEAAYVKDLLPGAVSKNLVHLFFSSERTKKERGVADEGVTPRPIEASALLGAGTMGGGIARLLASRYIPVRLKDVSPEALGAGLRAARELFERRLRRRRMSPWELKKKMALIAPTLDWSGFRRVDVVLEAIVEDLEIKKSVLRELEPVVGRECLIATNTSTLSVSAMQSVLEAPGRMAGFHFFNPVDRMPLIEVIRGEATDDVAVVSLVALAKRLGKTPIVVKDGPGFLVNRILGPYLNEAGYLLRETGNIEGIDRAFVEFGMPMGPLRLLDEVGLDVAMKAGNVLAAAFGERAASSGVVEKLVLEGRLGKKSGRGFYRYDGKKERPDATALAVVGVDWRGVSAKDAVERGLGLMIAEAARCLEEGIVRTAGELDLAMVMGTGFPPFRGGLLRYADATGLERVTEDLTKWRERLGIRFDPPRSLAERGTFYA